jgi:CRISPR-associated endonuclease/helicase Cas3
MEPAADYYRYWGKAQSAKSEKGPPCHLLLYHCLDVAAVGRIVLERDGARARHLASRLDLDPDVFIDLFVFSLALHDLGKFARAFQGLVSIDGYGLVPAHHGKPYKRRHDALGAKLWGESEQLVGHLEAFKKHEAGIDFDTEDALALWMGCFFGHHGKPVESDSTPLRADFEPSDLVAAQQFTREIERLISPNWPHGQLEDEAWRRTRLAPMTWQIAGLSMLSDWIGSNAHYFPYCTDRISPSYYLHQRALPAADQALTSTGLLERPIAVAYPGFQTSFGWTPTPLQQWAETVSMSSGPQLFLLEDITGAGKTEAAWTLAHRLLAEGHGKGLYFGLPTMATSNAMYQRLGAHYHRLYPKGSHPSLILAHGARHLESDFTGSIIPDPNTDRAYTPSEWTAGAECRSWLADNRKKALLAEVGVGTIDQALLGVLPRKHQALRLLGLSDKVLVVDEVHAYDSYTTELLRTLLTDHARQGASAILLSATMPRTLRHDLVDAWFRGRGYSRQTLNEGAFPLATQIYDDGIDEAPVAPRPSSQRDLPVRFVGDSEEAIEALVTAARSGQCACWIRNTVDDAIDAYQELRQRLDHPEGALLFHARFTMADRQRIEETALKRFGKGSAAPDRASQILVATQVVEQSLDLDFDVLITDLAPIELLIQRAGRLHRHCRDPKGNPLGLGGGEDQRSQPCLQVVAPNWEPAPGPDWVRSSLPGTASVYRNPVVLWRTLKVLREDGGIQLPARARALLDGVYGEDLALPDGLAEAFSEDYAKDRVKKASAHFNVLDLDQGYTDNAHGAGWDDDQELGTRFAEERTVPVILVDCHDDKVEPWHREHPHPWAMSTLTLRASQAERLPELPSALQEAVRSEEEAQHALRYARPWLASRATADGPIYDPVLGVVLPRTRGEH